MEEMVTRRVKGSKKLTFDPPRGVIMVDFGHFSAILRSLLR